MKTEVTYDELGRRVERAAREKRIAIEASYDGATYHLDGVSRGEMPRRRNFSSHGDMVEAVKKANPSYEII